MSTRQPIVYDILIAMFHQISKEKDRIELDYKKVEEFMLEQKDILELVGGIEYDKDRRNSRKLESYFTGLVESQLIVPITDGKTEYFLNGPALEIAYNRFVAPALVGLKNGRLEKLASDFNTFTPKS